MRLKTDAPKAISAFTLLAVACLTIMVGCVLVPGLPEIAAQLGVSRYSSSLIVMPALGVVVLGPLAGWLIGRLGLHRTLCTGLFLYGLIGATGALLHGELPVLVDRFLLGGATAMVMASGTGLISALYHGKARLVMMARQGMSIELGGMIFLLVSGLLATLGWRWPFALYLLAWVLLVMVILYVPSRVDAEEPADGPDGGRLVPLSAALRIVYCAAFFAMVSFFTGIIVLPIRLNELGMGSAQIGYFLAFVSLVAVGAAAALPRLVLRLGEHRVLLLGFLGYMAAHACFSIASGVTGFVAGGLLLGGGFGLSVPLVNHMTVEQSHPRERGRNLAYLSMATFSGQFASSFMVYLPGGTATVFAAAALVALLVLIGLIGAHWRRRAGTH